MPGQWGHARCTNANKLQPNLVNYMYPMTACEPIYLGPICLPTIHRLTLSGTLTSQAQQGNCTQQQTAATSLHRNPIQITPGSAMSALWAGHAPGSLAHWCHQHTISSPETPNHVTCSDEGATTSRQPPHCPLNSCPYSQTQPLGKPGPDGTPEQSLGSSAKRSFPTAADLGSTMPMDTDYIPHLPQGSSRAAAAAASPADAAVAAALAHLHAAEAAMHLSLPPHARATPQAPAQAPAVPLLVPAAVRAQGAGPPTPAVDFSPSGFMAVPFLDAWVPDAYCFAPDAEGGRAPQVCEDPRPPWERDPLLKALLRCDLLLKHGHRMAQAVQLGLGGGEGEVEGAEEREGERNEEEEYDASAGSTCSSPCSLGCKRQLRPQKWRRVQQKRQQGRRQHLLQALYAKLQEHVVQQQRMLDALAMRLEQHHETGWDEAGHQHLVECEQLGLQEGALLQQQPVQQLWQVGLGGAYHHSVVTMAALLLGGMLLVNVG